MMIPSYGLRTAEETRKVMKASKPRSVEVILDSEYIYHTSKINQEIDACSRAGGYMVSYAGKLTAECSKRFSEEDVRTIRHQLSKRIAEDYRATGYLVSFWATGDESFLINIKWSEPEELDDGYKQVLQEV